MYYILYALHTQTFHTGGVIITNVYFGTALHKYYSLLFVNWKQKNFAVCAPGHLDSWAMF